MVNVQIEIIWSDDEFNSTTSLVSRIANQVKDARDFTTPGNRHVKIKDVIRVAQRDRVLDKLREHWGPDSHRDEANFRLWILDLDWFGDRTVGLEHIHKFAEEDGIQTDGALVVSSYAADFREQLDQSGIKRRVQKVVAISRKPLHDEILEIIGQMVDRRSNGAPVANAAPAAR